MDSLSHISPSPWLAASDNSSGDVPSLKLNDRTTDSIGYGCRGSISAATATPNTDDGVGRVGDSKSDVQISKINPAFFQPAHFNQEACRPIYIQSKWRQPKMSAHRQRREHSQGRPLEM